MQRFMGEDAHIFRGSPLKSNVLLRSHERLLCVSTYVSDGVGLGVRISWRTSTWVPSSPFKLAFGAKPYTCCVVGTGSAMGGELLGGYAHPAVEVYDGGRLSEALYAVVREPFTLSVVKEAVRWGVWRGAGCSPHTTGEPELEAWLLDGVPTHWRVRGGGQTKSRCGGSRSS